MSERSKRANHVKQVFVCDYKDGTTRIYKKRNQKQIRDDYKKGKKEEYAPAFYSKEEKKNKFGVFNKKGWKVLCLFASREQAQEFIDKKGQYAKLYEVRELDWGEDND